MGRQRKPTYHVDFNTWPLSRAEAAKKGHAEHGRRDKPRREKKKVGNMSRDGRGSIFADEPTRSTHERCPLCRHIRTKYFRANAWHPGRVMWARLTPDGPKVCHICQERHKPKEETP